MVVLELEDVEKSNHGRDVAISFGWHSGIPSRNGGPMFATVANLSHSPNKVEIAFRRLVTLIFDEICLKIAGRGFG